MRTTTTYTKSFKENAVAKLLGLGSGGLSKTAENLGIPAATLFGWKKKYANHSGMKKSKNKTITDWSPEQKLEAIIKTSAMNENELGKYLRTNGLFFSDLESFKKDSLAGFKSKGRPKLDPEVTELRKQKKTLERDLRRTEKALAEQSARIILLKKSQEIWGGSEDEE